MNNDLIVLRELAREYSEIANKPVQTERRNLWRKHNSFNRVKPPIYIRAFAFNEILDKNKLKCIDPFWRSYEVFFNMMKFRDTIGDDFIIEPWITVGSVHESSGWGFRFGLGSKPVAGGAAGFNPVLLEEEDINKFVIPSHKINETATKERYERVKDALGDIIEINLNRDPAYKSWSGDISTQLAMMCGLEQIMWYVYDRPEWLHKILKLMSEGILKTHDEAEKAGDFSLTSHENQAMTYTELLKDPKPNTFGIGRNELWWYLASQEFTGIGPDMFNEFLLQYQMPIMQKFGLVAYGCCEDLTHKIDYLRKIPNLRRIAVSPFSDAKKCAEQIGDNYILSWRPSPSLMVSQGLDEEFVRKFMREHFSIFKDNNNYFDITLKDVETINNKPENVIRWVKIVREEIDRAFD